MPQSGTPYIIPLGAAGMVPQQNRWLAQPGQMTLAENVTLENDLLQLEPASAYYNVGGFGARPLEWLVIEGKFVDPTIQSRGCVVWCQARGPVQAETTSILAATATAPQTWTVANVGAVPAGAAHVIAVSRDRQASSSVATAITDSAGNIYRLLADSGVAANLHRVQLWAAFLTTALPAGGSLTVTLAQSGLNVAMLGRWYTDIASLTPIASQLITPYFQVDPAQALGLFTSTASVLHGPEYTGAHTYPLRGIAALASDDTTNDPPCQMDDPSWMLTRIPSPSAAHHLLIQFTQFYAGSDVGIIGQIEWNSLALSTLTGTVTARRGSSTVIGTGTFFLEETRPGDLLAFQSGSMRRVISVQSDTQLMTEAPWDFDFSGPMDRRAGPVLITAAIYGSVEGRGIEVYKERSIDGTHGFLNQTTLTTLPFAASMRRARFITGGQEVALNPRKLFLFTGVMPVQVLSGDGKTMTDIALPALDWDPNPFVPSPNKQPVNGIVHSYCLIAFGNANFPHQIYISNPENHEDFQTSTPSPNQVILLNIASNVGERLWCAAIYQGVCFFWKYPCGIFYLDDTIGDRLQWSYRTRSMELGCAPSPFAVLALEDDVLFCDPTAHFHLLSAVASLGGTADSDLTRILGLQQWTTENIDLPSLGQMTSVYDNTTKTAWFGFRSRQAVAAGSPNNDLIVRFEFGTLRQSGPRVRVTTARCWVADALCMKHRHWVDQNAIVISGIAQSYFHIPLTYGSRVDRDFLANVDVTSGIPALITCSEDDFDSQMPGKLRNIRKRYAALEVVAQAQPFSQALTVQVLVDSIVRQTLKFAGGVPRRRNMQKLNCGDGYTLTLQATTDGTVAADLPLNGFIVYYHPAGTDMSRTS